MNNTTLEKAAESISTLLDLQNLMEQDRIAFLSQIRKLPKNSTKTVEDQTNFFNNLFTITNQTEFETSKTFVEDQIILKKNTNESLCEACGDIVTLLPREGKKTAYCEVTTVIRCSKRILYWCQECTETDSVEAQIMALENMA